MLKRRFGGVQKVLTQNLSEKGLSGKTGADKADIFFSSGRPGFCVIISHLRVMYEFRKQVQP